MLALAVPVILADGLECYTCKPEEAADCIDDEGTLKPCIDDELDSVNCYATEFSKYLRNESRTDHFIRDFRHK